MPSPGLAALALHAGLLGLVGLWLASHVGRVRRETGILVGDGGNPRMVRAMRGQANFVETVPLALLLLLVMALMGGPAWAVHLLGGALLVGRVLHGLHFTRDAAPFWQRGAGSGLSFLVLLLAALGAAGHGLAALR